MITVASIIALAGSQGELYSGSIPILVVCMMGSFLIHWLVFIPSYLAKSEKFYDITGTLAYLSLLIVTSLYTSSVSDSVITDRSVLLIGFLTVWSLRLGIFLFTRIMKSGEDKRFREIKVSFSKFLVTWTLSALWVFITSANALITIINNVPLSGDIVAYVGILVWVLGFLFEVIADEQKKRFHHESKNSGDFISDGLWRYTRHPNYFGEIMLWSGIAIISLSTLSGWQYVTLISPLFVFLLLTRVSGINLLELKADQMWGHREDYNNYKKTTPVLVPFINKVLKR
jgi:steroid 5-alpha reductase family enzyme